MPALPSTSRTQEHLLLLLVYLAHYGAHWFTINGDTSNKLSLCRRLGFCNETDYYAFLVYGGLVGYETNKKTGNSDLEIYRNAWSNMLTSHPDNEELFELNQKEVDMENAMRSIPQQRTRPHRYDYHVLSIGEMDYDSYCSISEQLKFESLIPPTPNAIKSTQHKLLHNIRRMITDTIINNQDMYD